MSNANDLLTKQDCLEILSNYTNSSKPLFKSHSINKLESLEGLLGEHYKVKIQYEEDGKVKDIQLFLKVPPSGSNTVRELALSIRADEKEEFWYTYLMKEYKVHRLRLDFAPKCYFGRPAVLVLEDLSLAGYRNSPKKDMLDARHCKIALKSLAQFHASTILYEHIKANADKNYVNLGQSHSENFEDIFFSGKKTAATEWFECTFKGLMNLIGLLPEADISAEKYKAKLVETLENSSKQEPTKYINTVLHGDLWSNNFMFKYEGEVPIDSVLIDYQVLKYGPMALDVVQMVLTNVRRSVRDVHYEELLSYYYHQFVEYCNAHHFDAITFISYKDFMKSCEDVKMNAMLQSVADHSITLLVDEAMGDVYQSEEEVKKFLFSNRNEIITLSYKENDLYREILTEDLVELREMLFNV